MLQRQSTRDLGGSDDNQGSYLVDKNGELYEPYSLAWRYLGMYMDCDPTQQQYADEADQEFEGRRGLEGDGDENDCSRKLLWAAVSDGSP